MKEPLESIPQCFFNHYWIKARRRKSNVAFIANTFKKQFKFTSKYVSVLPKASSEDDISPNTRHPSQSFRVPESFFVSLEHLGQSCCKRRHVAFHALLVTLSVLL